MITQDNHARSKTNIMALVPARGGSKGIPGKNLADLGGKPLIAHSILAATNCSLIDRVVVSTDCPEIAEVSRKWGAQTPFLRPAKLSHDTANLGDVIAHTLQTLKLKEGYVPEAIVILYPTHPFRTRWLMEHLTSMLLAGHRQVCTVRAIPFHDFSHFVPGGAPFARPMPDEGNLPSQCFFRHYGLYIGTKLRGECTKEFYLHQLRSETELLDIDEAHHLARANELIRFWNPEKGGVAPDAQRSFPLTDPEPGVVAEASAPAPDDASLTRACPPRVLAGSSQGQVGSAAS